MRTGTTRTATRRCRWERIAIRTLTRPCGIRMNTYRTSTISIGTELWVRFRTTLLGVLRVAIARWLMHHGGELVESIAATTKMASRTPDSVDSTRRNF